MLYYDGIDLSEGIDVNKTSASKECDICRFWCFLDKESQFQSDVCNGCYDVLMMSLTINDITILNISGIDYRCSINRISKSDSVNLLRDAELIEERGVF